MRRTPALPLALAVLLLTACTGGDAPVPAGGPTTDASAPAADGADDAPAATQEPVSGGASAQCLAGTWHLDLAALQGELERAVAGGGGVEVAVEGSTTYEFGDGGVFRADVDSASTLTMSGGDERLTSTSRSTGRLTGTWALEGEQLVISDVDTRDLAVTTTAAMDDEPLDVPAGTAEDTVEALPPSVSTLGCSADRASLVTTLQTDEDSDPTTVTYALHR